ncbi:ZCHC3 protein, partial [Polyodon spathula]|nr:ZCHC3 protein [Polyodon spathula]
VTMACPFFPVEDITTFLKRRFELRSEDPVKSIDTEGLWNGVFKYTARLYTREGKMIHIRPDLMIGTVRGTLYYKGQPRVCFKCSRSGHFAAECGEVVCRNCLQMGHVARDCPGGMMCNLCGSKEHMYKDCPQ